MVPVEKLVILQQAQGNHISLCFGLLMALLKLF